MTKRTKLAPMRITEDAPARSGLRVPLNAETLTNGYETTLDVVNVADRVDVRRILPVVPELHSFPVDYVHDHAMVKRAGGLPLIVEGIAEFLPGVRFDRPETIPPPVRAVMRALHRRTPFGLVIIVEPKAWWIDLRSDVPRLPRGR